MTTNIIPMTTKNYLVVIIVALVTVWLPHHVSHALIPVISPSFLWNSGVPTAKSSTVGSSTRLYSSPFGSNPKDKPRRQKKNKYKKQEENSKDPLELLLEESEQKLQELNQQKQQKNKKKIPAELDAIQTAPRTFVFPDNKDIDPNDPASFGFIEIGTVVGAHGVHGEIKVKSSSGFPERFTQPGIKYFKPHNKRAPRKVVLVKGRGPNKDDEYILQLADTTNRDDAKRLRGGTLFVRKEDRQVLLKNSNNNANTNSNSNNNQKRSRDDNDKTMDTEEDDDETEQDNNSNMQQSKTTQDETVEEEEFFVSDLVGLEVFLETTTKENSNDTSDNDNHHEPPQLFVGTVVGVVLAEDMCAIPGLGHDMLEINLPRGKGGTTSLRDELVLIPFVPQIVPRVDSAIYIDPPAGLLDLTYVREEKVRIKGFLPPSE